MRGLQVVFLLIFYVTAHAADGGLGVNIGMSARVSGPSPVIIQTIPEDGSTLNSSTPTFRIVFNTDMDTSRLDASRVGLPTGLIAKQLIWANTRTLDITYDGFLPNFGAKRLDLFDGYFITPGKISIALGSGLAFNFNDPNHAPLIVVLPTGVTTNGVTQFSSLGFDQDGDALTYTWDFGDGSTGTGANPVHTYAGAGPFLATLTVSDGKNSGSASASVLVGAAAKVPWIVIKASVSLNFAKPGRDKITVQGTIDLPPGFDPKDQKVMIDVGGVQQLFTMTSKGTAKTGKDRMTLKRKLKKKVFLGGAVKITFKLSGDFVSRLADDGFTNVTTPKAGTKVPVVMGLVVANQPYEAIPELLYKAKEKKTGKASKKTAIR